MRVKTLFYAWVRDAQGGIKVDDISLIPEWAWNQLEQADQIYIIKTYGEPNYANTSNSST